MEALLLSLLNGLSYSLLLFLLASGLTLIFSLLGVLNFAHGSFYMLGAYLAWQSGQWLGFWGGLLAAPIGVAAVATLFELGVLRRLRPQGHLPELLATFAFGVVLVEVARLLWGSASVPYGIPAALQGSLFRLGGLEFAAYRGFVMAVALAALDPDDRDVLSRCDLQGMTQKDYAQANGLSLPAVKSRVLRARARLRLLLVERCGVRFDAATGRVCCSVPRQPASACCSASSGTTAA